MKTILTILTALLLAPLAALNAAEPLRLQNDKLALHFDAASGTLTAIENKLTGETYRVSGDEFAIETVEGDIGFAKFKPVAVKLTGDTLAAQYEVAGLTVEVRHQLGAGQHFAERSMWLTSGKKLGVKKIVLGRPTFAAEGLEMVSYRQPALMNPKGQEPILTCFGRTARGGFFTGVELPFDASSQNANTVFLAYRPNLRIRAGERLDCEPAYFGVYKRNADEVPQKDLPLRSESDAMVAMTSIILPPQNKYLGACLASWWSEMYRGPYRTMADVENHMRAIDFALECGIAIIADTRVWSGEFDKVNALREGDDLHFGDLALKLTDYILLSALSCSPSQTFYLPTQAGIPAEDKREIKKWLDWGRANIHYLFVRKDLPHWPTPGKVDGSAHILGDRGLVFLFNPNPSPASGEFALTKESIGLTGDGEFRIAQEHPAPGRTQTARAGEPVRWEVPAQTAVVLRIQKPPSRK